MIKIFRILILRKKQCLNKVSDTKKVIKSAKQVFQETAQKAIKSGDNVVKDGRVIATSSKKSIEKSYDAVKAVNTKITDVTEKVASATKSKVSKIQAYGSTKVDDVAGYVNKGTPKAKEVYTNTKSVKPKKVELKPQTKGVAQTESKEIVNGPYIKNGKPNGRPTLTGEKKLQFEKEVYNNNVDLDGVLRDPNTKEVIIWKPGQTRKNVVDFGHKSGKSYKEIFKKYKNGDITLDELKEFQFNPKNYRLETPSANRSHKFE